MAAGNNCVVLLIDESAAMSAVMRDKLADGTESTKTSAERVATSVNNLLRQLIDGPACDVAVVGYRIDNDEHADVGCRWPVSLTGCEFVSSGELGTAARMETRTKRVPQADGSITEEQVQFSVWYDPVLGSKGPQIAAFKFCRDLVDRHTADGGGQALIVHVFAGSSGDGSPQKAVEDLLQSAGAPLIAQCHLASSSALVTTAFPSKQAYLASPLARDLFVRASELPDHLRDCLRAAKVQFHAGARALVHNAKITDLFRCLQLAKYHVRSNSAAAPPAVPVAQAALTAATATTASAPHDAGLPAADGVTTSQPELAVNAPSPDAGHAARESLVVFVLDRSVEDPFSGNMANSCSRLQEAANELLKQLSTKTLASLPIDTAIISYGLTSDGQVDLRATFDGPLVGRQVVRNAELPEGAIRVEEEETQVSNGAGGLVTVKKKTPIFFDVEPAGAAVPHPAFEAAAAVVKDWCERHPAGAAPIVFHLTRGTHEPSVIEAAAGLLSGISTTSGSVLLHHLVATETPHKSLAYPDTDSDIDSPSLKSLWQASSHLSDWERLHAAKRPYVTAASRGVVINGRFDVLSDVIAHAATGDAVATA